MTKFENGIPTKPDPAARKKRFRTGFGEKPRGDLLYNSSKSA